MSIQILVGKKFPIDLSEFGGTVTLDRFDIVNFTPTILKTIPGALLPLRPGVARILVLDRSNGRQIEKIYNIIDPHQGKALVVPTRTNVIKKTDRTHTSIMWFDPAVLTPFGREQIRFKYDEGTDVWSYNFGTELDNAYVDVATVGWPAEQVLTYNSTFGKIWFVCDKHAPIIVTDGVAVEDQIVWRGTTPNH